MADISSKLDVATERGIQMKRIIEHDIVVRGLSFDAAVESLADYLGISPEAVRLAVALANEKEGVL